ncbi:hypothetical protein L2E82_14279 [Cichorium intybus]|uniref:Uncharacterized protein n=1 Tax=Cichorium intybus TaxID=13427 RepID=A0ACB9EZL2_CICIN|nr:hypothetical protein L2E82_14279 [Cichorium intybus]
MSSLKQKPSVTSSSTTTSPYCKIETPKYLYRSNQQIPSELNPVFTVQISSNTLRHLQLPEKSMTTEGIRPPPSISSHTDSTSDVRCEIDILLGKDDVNKWVDVDGFWSEGEPGNGDDNNGVEVVMSDKDGGGYVGLSNEWSRNGGMKN